VKWKTFTFLYDKFTQDNTYQILSESVGFVEETTKHFDVFFGSQCRISLINVQKALVIKLGSRE